MSAEQLTLGYADSQALARKIKLEEKIRRNKFRKDRRSIVADWIREYKSSRRCCGCGISDYRVLQFHHRPEAKKLHNVSDMVVRGMPVKEIEKEIRKCRLLCANCHRLEHITGDVPVIKNPKRHQQRSFPSLCKRLDGRYYATDPYTHRAIYFGSDPIAAKRSYEKWLSQSLKRWKAKEFLWKEFDFLVLLEKAARLALRMGPRALSGFARIGEAVAALDKLRSAKEGEVDDGKEATEDVPPQGEQPGVCD